MNTKSYSGSLRIRFTDWVEAAANFLRSGEIHAPTEARGRFLPEYSPQWAPLTPALHSTQAELLAQLDDLQARLRPLIRHATDAERASVDASTLAIRSWIETRDLTRLLSRSPVNRWRPYKFPITPVDAADDFKQSCRPIDSFLGKFQPSEGDPTSLVLDTNALVDCTSLETIARFTVTGPVLMIIPAPVIAELDQLKGSRKNEEVRATARRAIRELGRLRSLGDVLRGVSLTRDVTVKMTAHTPDFSDLPLWLDKTNADDQILAGALEYQFGHPKLVVMIVTRDINMQNKAALAGLTAIEGPMCARDAA